MSTALTTLTQKLAATLNMGDGKGLENTLKATVFKDATDDQLAALIVVANQYGLNPWTKEIYAFPHKGKIVPVVGVDGWSRIINTHPQFDGLDFEQDNESCTCIIWRKDRAHPIKITEWLSECRRTNSEPWKEFPRRMLRHKALIQCARLAFGYVGIYDQDEAERIIEAEPIPQPLPQRPALTAEPVALPQYSNEQFNENVGKWQDLIESGKSTAARIIAMIQSKATLSEEQKLAIYDLAPPDDGAPAQAA